MLVFIDQSGDIHPKGSVPKAVLAAVCLSENRSRNLSREMFNIKKRLIENPDDFELKGHKLLTRSTFEKRPAKREVVESTFELIRNLDMVVFAMVMDRPVTAPSFPRGHVAKPVSLHPAARQLASTS